MRRFLLSFLFAALTPFAFGQGGTATQIRSGSALPASASANSIFIINDGSGAIYVCSRSPSCTAPGHWVAITAKGVISSFAVAPTTINFGTVTNGSTSDPQSIAISNNGTVTVNVQSVVSDNAKFSSTNPNICNIALVQGNTCVFSYSYSPTTSVTDTGTITVTTDAANSPLTIAVSGTGTAGATFPVNVSASGSGQIASGESTPLINCFFSSSAPPTGTCSNNYLSGASVTLTATPASDGSTFGGYSGGGCGVPNSCTFVVSAATNVSATFNPPATTFVLNITGIGQGTATITSDKTDLITGQALNCVSTAGVTSSGGGAGCSGTFTQGTVITLTETPNASSTFVGWTGISGCTTASTCAVTLTAPATATANITLSVAPISLVQTTSNCSVSGSTIACTWASAMTVGDDIICAGGWPDATTTVSSISDTKGNTYSQVPTVSPKVGTALTQVVYYSQNIVAATAGSNVTTMTLSSNSGAVSGSTLTAGNHNGSPFTTASIAPTSNDLVLIAVDSALSSGNGPGAITSITGNSLTWVFVTGIDYGATQGTAKSRRIEVWRALGASPTTGTITISFSTNPIAAWTVDQFSGVDTSGTNGSGAVGIFASNQNSSASPATVTMGTFGSSSNGTYGAVGDLSTNVYTAASNMTLLGSNTTNLTILSEWAVANISPVTATYTGTNTWGIIGIEIKAATTGRRDMRCVEYSGVLASGSPIDVSAAAVGTSSTPASGSSTTTVAGDVITGFLLSNQSENTESSGYTQRIKNSFGDTLADRESVAISTSSNYQPTLTASGNWISTNISWKAAGTSPPTTFSLTVTGGGTGTGTITSNSGSPLLNCTITNGSTSGTCSTSVTSGSTVTLTSVVGANSSFGGWTGVTGCSTGSTCQVPNITSNQIVTATFNLSSTQNFYIATNGSDANNCTASSAPCLTFGKVIPLLTAGSTLNLANGTYTLATNGAFSANCSTTAHTGTVSAPVTVQATNERQALIQGNGLSDAFSVTNCSYWNIVGLHVKAQDAAGANNSSVMNFVNDANLSVRRNILDHPNRCANDNVLLFQNSTNSILEENELYFFHRWGIILYSGSTGNEVRRNYSNSRGYFQAANPTCTTYGQGSVGVGPYYGNSNKIENNISENTANGVNLEAASSNNTYLGNIAISSTQVGFQTNPHCPDTGSNNLWSNNVAINNSFYGWWIIGSTAATFDHNTIIGGGETYGFRWDQVNASNVCGAQSFTSTNNTVQNNGTGYYINTAVNTPSFSYDHDNSFGNTTSYNPNTNVTNANSSNPTFGTCMLWAPAGTPLVGAGTGGTNIGATVEYEYISGSLTSIPLWSAANGSFRQGATVTGLNDVAGSSLFDIQNRVNAKQNGCAFRSSYTGW